MDWSANLHGLSPAFTNASGIGGGSIQVIFFFRRSLLKRTILRPQLQILLSWLSSLPDLYQREHLGTKLEDLVIYTTTQTPTLGSKAGRMLGLQVRTINVAPDDQFALRGRALRDALEKDAKIG